MVDMDATKILSVAEVLAVFDDLKFRARRSVNSKQNLIVFRLSACCGLRVMEIAGLNVGDVVTNGGRPCVRVRKEITKGVEAKRKNRIVPLWWDEGTREDIAYWWKFRHEANPASPLRPFICNLREGGRCHRLSKISIAKRWRTAIRILGPERVKQLSIHSGRHTFISHALSVGRSLAEVRDAAGHANLSTTSVYTHFLERSGIPDLFPKTEVKDD